VAAVEVPAVGGNGWGPRKTSMSPILSPLLVLPWGGEFDDVPSRWRYLITRLDERKQARPPGPAAPKATPAPKPPSLVRFRTFRDMWADPDLWNHFR
jgi:hypothetical protein